METIVEKFILQLEAQLARAARRDRRSRPRRAPSWPRRATTRCSARGRSAALIQTEVRDPLTDEILFGQLEHGGTVVVGVANEKITFEYRPSPAPSEPSAAPSVEPEPTPTL